MKAGEFWGRFTARGGAEVEAEIRGLVLRAARLVEARIPREDYRALLLTGGYGRGEGGIERRAGVERPHNNLDFLLVTTRFGSAEQAALKRTLDELLLPLAEAGGVGIDTGVVAEWRLRIAPCLVRWFDMRFGHKTVSGDLRFASSLTRFHAGAIDPADVLELLVNRATLLVVNGMITARGARTRAAQKAVVRHAMKAIIGYGDACLFALGQYDWSYAERQRRMRRDATLPAAFRELYDAAIEFRFEPAYDRWLARDPAAWMARLAAELAPMHLFFEAWRLRAPGLTWEAYPDIMLRRSLRGALGSPAAFARRARDLAASTRRDMESFGGGVLQDLALRCGGPRMMLCLAIPAVLYGAGGARYAELARRVLGADDTSPAALRRAYLERWGEHGDINFSTAARALDLPIAPLEAAP